MKKIVVSALLAASFIGGIVISASADSCCPSANSESCDTVKTSEYSANQKKVAVKKAKAKKSAKSYACPMHPEVISGKAGKCGECGMKLEKK